MTRSSPLIDTRIIYCGDCLDQLRKLPDGCVYIDPLPTTRDTLKAIIATSSPGLAATSSDALTEIDAYFRKSHKVIVPFTVREILDEHLAHKLA
jgi:hypothetical protein